MAVISFASAKGGVGKTTGAVNVAAELALEGYKTAIVDCDVNRHATQFWQTFSANTPEAPLRCYSEARRNTIVGIIDEAQETSDIVIVDLPAGTTEFSMRSIQLSQLVVIPAQKTVVDTRDALRTAAVVAEAGRLTRQEIRGVLLWSKVPARFETVTERKVREDFLSMVVDPDRAVLSAQMLEYDAYPAGFYYGWVPRQFGNKAGQMAEVRRRDGTTRPVRIPTSTAKAAANVREISKALLDRLTALTEGREPGRLSLKPDVLRMVSHMPESAEA